MGDTIINKEVKIEEIAARLPLNKYFTKAQFSEYTGILFKSCTVRIGKLRKNGFLKANYNQKTARYMMTEDCWIKMIEQGVKNKSARKKILDSGRKSRVKTNSNFDELLFSTKLI